jgi:ATP-binding protein involved in chromosome partitioning
MVPELSAEFRALVEDYSDPYLGQTLGDARAVESAELKGDRAHVRVVLGIPVGDYQDEFARALRAHIAAGGGPANVDIELTSKITAHAVQRQLAPLAGVRNIVAVASGKGGVGKSTVAANLALAWARQGARVGILDADIYGPSQPIMLGLAGQRPSSPDGKRIKPLPAHGVVAMSIGFLIDAEQPMVWRGPMVTQALTQLLSDTDWGELDYLVIDLPPGTSDAQLTLAQAVPISGSVLVTTPQEVSLSDVAKALAMFQRMNVPVLGIVENMTAFACPHCGELTEIFGRGGGERFAAQHSLEYLGGIPLDITVRQGGDVGVPAVAQREPGPAAQALTAIAQTVAARMSVRAAAAEARPLLTIS